MNAMQKTGKPSERRFAATRRGAIRISLAIAISSLSGCATVKPWQRELLADPIMQPDRNPIAAGLYEHVYFSREASNGGRSVGGGGCGCN